MNPTALLREALATARASRIPSLLTALVVAAMCLATLMTVGRSAAAAADIAHQMEQAGARRLSVTDTAQAGFINAPTLATIQSLSTVERAVAVTTATDVTSGALGPGGPRIPLWHVLGDATDATHLVLGRAPQPGEAIVACDILPTLRWETASGYLIDPASQAQYPVVGCYQATAPLNDLAAGAITPAAPGTPGQDLRVLLTDIAAAQATTDTVISILAPHDPAAAAVDSPTHLAATAQALHTRMNSYGRSLLGLILGIGALFIAAVVFSDTLVHRRDLGRRRTLGITRPDLVTLVAARTLIPATAGAILGTTLGWTITHWQHHTIPTDFTLAIPILATITAALAAIPPAIHASRRDPVAVMRTP